MPITYNATANRGEVWNFCISNKMNILMITEEELILLKLRFSNLYIRENDPHFKGEIYKLGGE